MAHLTTRDMTGNEARDSLLTDMRSGNQHWERGMPIISAQKRAPVPLPCGRDRLQGKKKAEAAAPALYSFRSGAATHHAFDDNGRDAREHGLGHRGRQHVPYRIGA